MARVNIVFFKEDAMGIKPHDNDPLVITVQNGIWDIRCVLIDMGSSIDVMFWDVFQKLQLNLDDIQRFNDSQIGLSGEHVQI